MSIKLRNWSENLPSSGNEGGSSVTTFDNSSKSVAQPEYGYFPMASSSTEIPKLQTSARISYGVSGGSILSG